MILTLDNLASRYHCLPSEALARADTLDLYVLDIGAKWSNHQYEKANGKETAKPLPNLSQEEMLLMVARAKGKAKGA